MEPIRVKAETAPFLRPLFPINVYRAFQALGAADLLGMNNAELKKYVHLAEKALQGEIDSVPPRLAQGLTAAIFYLGLSPMDQHQFRAFVDKCARANYNV